MVGHSLQYKCISIEPYVFVVIMTCPVVGGSLTYTLLMMRAQYASLVVVCCPTKQRCCVVSIFLHFTLLLFEKNEKRDTREEMEIL